MTPDTPDPAPHLESPPRPSQPSEGELLRRYMGDTPPLGMSRKTEALRRVLRGETRRRATRYWIALGGLAVVALGVLGYAMVQRERAERAAAAAADLFYAAKALELQVSRLALSAEEQQQVRERRAVLEERYHDYLEELGIYGEETPPGTRLIYEVVHRFGETEVGVPKRFLRDVERRIALWRSTGRLDSSMARAQAAGYGPRTAAILLEHNLSPDFFYV
ncbi:MAG TPA: hypothetical protein VFH97_07930, partial [Gemmatimonadales bacterium]|nr:hypothetical protein [Gemmatimonadales bacterium]